MISGVKTGQLDLIVTGDERTKPLLSKVKDQALLDQTGLVEIVAILYTCN